MPEIDFAALAAFAVSHGIEVLENEPMARHTTFRIGGPARLFFRPHTVEELAAAADECRKRSVPVLALGNGSNLLIADKGYPGAVISLAALKEIRREETGVLCGAGASLKEVCLFARDEGLTGLEFAYGIPGTAGGAVFMNAGAYGGEMRDVVDRSGYLDGAVIGSYSGAEHDFAYRHSIYAGSGKIVTRVHFALAPGEKERISARMKELMDRRKAKQPLEYPSAGSVFKRPPGHYAGTLIDQCGLKGTRVGGAAVSEKHAGFIVNLGGATCADVIALIRKIQETVKEKTGVSLESEIRVIGS